MTKRAAWILAILLAFVVDSRADITNADLIQLADSYRSSLKPIQEAPEEVLRRLNEARKANAAADVVHWSEALVALGDRTPQTWLTLSKAWMQIDSTASNGLAAAVEAARLAQDSNAQADRLEALLLVSSFLRAKLDTDRARYDDALEVAKGAEAALGQVDELTADGQLLAPDPNNPDGRIEALRRTIAEADRESQIAASDISSTVSALDEIYRELQAAIPSLAIGEMQQADKRLDFHVKTDERDVVVPKYEFHGNDVRICLSFSKMLKQDSLVYEGLVRLTQEDQPVDRKDFNVLADKDTLCVLRLAPGEDYMLTLPADFPAEDGTLLAAEVDIQVFVPNLPASVSFGDGEFILPRSGPGQLPISFTNIEDVPLSLHRVVDRSLYRHLALGQIRNGVPNAEYQDLLERFSEVLWQGTAKRRFEDSEWNTTVRMLVPVGSILKDRSEWLRGLDARESNRLGELSSGLQPVHDISDPQLTVEGRFQAGSLDADPENAKAFVPGVYALVAPIPVPEGEEKDYHCDVRPITDCEVYAAQWFIQSDLGLTFYEGDHEFTVMVRSLESGEPVAGAQVQLVAQGNRLLAEQASDENGVAVFKRAITRGEGSNKLIAVMVETADDFNFLQYGSERLDLSRLNVGSAVEENRERALLYTERGIYQPGETIHALGLLRERMQLDPLLQSAELRLEISDYTVAKRRLRPADWSAGGSLVSLTVPPTARPGTAVLKLVASTDEVVAETRLQIGKIRPDRARLDFRHEAGAGVQAIRTGTNTASISAEVRAQYLYGAEGTSQAPAANLKAELTVRVAPAVVPAGKCYDGFVFGAFDDESLPAVSRNRVEFTDAGGMLNLNLDQVRLPSTSRPLVGTIEVTLFDASGPIAAGQSDVAIPPEQTALGLSVHPQLSSGEAAGYDLALDVVSLDATGAPAIGRDLTVLVERENESYAWQLVDDVWQHIALRQRDKILQESVRLEGELKGAHGGCAGYLPLEKVAASLPAGHYVVTVTDADSGAMASVRFVTGVAQTSVNDLEPNLFVLSSDKARYAPGEQVSLSIDAPFRTGKATVAVATGDILHWYSGTVVDGHATVAFTTEKAWAGKGLHALATVFKQDAANTRQLGPSRAIGATYFEVSDEAGFDVSVVAQTLSEHDSIRPGEPLTFDVCVKRADGTCNGDFAGEAYAVAFVADEGLLSLTNHSSAFASIKEEFFGRHKLGLRMMDNYGRLLLHEGGDRPGRMALTNYTSPRIVAASQGPRKLENGRASFAFPDPGLQSGSLKVFVVAWSPSQVSTAEHTVAVRNLFVSSLGLPEFFLAGDRPELPLRLENIGFSDHRGDYSLTLSAAGGIAARLTRTDGTPLDEDATGAFRIQVPMGAPQDLRVALDIPEKLQGKFDLSLGVTAVGAQTDLPPQERVRKWTLDVRPSTVVVSEYLPPIPLQAKPANLARVVEGVIEGRYDPDSVQVTARFASKEDTLRLAASDPTAAPAKNILEDSIWRGMIDLQDKTLINDPVVKANVQAYADSVQALQLVDGSFAPYRTNGNFMPAEIGADGTRYGLLDSVAALDFLIRARAAGYAISADALRNALAFVETSVDAVFEIDSEGRADPLDPKAACSFDTRYAMLLLAQQDRLKSAYVDAVRACDDNDDGGDDGGGGGSGASEAAVEPGIFSQLVTLAVLSQYGEVVDPEDALAAYYDKPADYLGDLDDYRKAIAVSMLADARADTGTVKHTAETLLSGGRQLDLRTRAWLARTVADLDSPRGQRLKSSDLSLSDADVMPLSERPDGIVQSQAIAYRALQDSELEISKPNEPQASAYLRITGIRTDSDDLALPETSFRRRLFCAVNGKEIDLATQQLEVGDDVVLVVEATRDALSQFDPEAYEGVGTTYGPLMVHTPLPSAFSLVAADMTGIKPTGDLAGLAMAGRVRSVDSDPQSWNAIIVPVSTTPKFEADRKLHKSSDDGEESEGSDEGEGSDESEGSDDSQSAVGPQGDDSSVIDAAEDGIEFRQAFVATVGSTGSYSFPPTTIEPLDFPSDTLVSGTGRFEVGGPSPCRPR
jgi:uncharacterized protein YfaS (alpha-2-macroglobulin family)